MTVNAAAGRVAYGSRNFLPLLPPAGTFFFSPVAAGGFVENNFVELGTT